MRNLLLIYAFLFTVSGNIYAGTTEREDRENCEKGDPGGCYYWGMKTGGSNVKNIKRLTVSLQAHQQGCAMAGRERTTTYKYNARVYIDQSCDMVRSRKYQIAVLTDPEEAEKIYESILKAHAEKGASQSALNARADRIIGAVREYIFSPCSNIGLLTNRNVTDETRAAAVFNSIRREGKYCISDNGGAKFTYGIYNVSKQMSCDPESENAKGCRFSVFLSCKMTSDFGRKTDNVRLSNTICAPYNKVKHPVIASFAGNGNSLRVTDLKFLFDQ